MKARVLRVVVATAGLVGLSSVALADAPSDQYAFFGPYVPFINDNQTGLTWERSPPATAVGFDAAVTACASLALPGYPAGVWRVPSYKELLTLVDESPHVEYQDGGLVTLFIDPNAFPGTQATRYWSSSPYLADALSQPQAYAVDFSAGSGTTANLDSESLPVRCVTP